MDGGRGSLQRGNLEEKGELGEGQVEVLHDPQHGFRLDVGPARQEWTADPDNGYCGPMSSKGKIQLVNSPVLLDEDDAGDVVGGPP